MDAEYAIERMTDELLDALANDMNSSHFRQKAMIRQYLSMAYGIGRDRRVNPAPKNWPESTASQTKEETLPNSLKYAKRQTG
jgi:hypothetical protein